MTPKLKALGFPFLMSGREYDPVEVKIKMSKETLGRDRKGWQTYPSYGPYDEWTKLWCISAGSDYRLYHFFIRHPNFQIVCSFNRTDVQILFEAEPFFYIMENASRNNKLMFFRQAVVEDEKEVEHFLELVEASDMSEKDKNRARTWVYRRGRNLDI